MSSKTKEQQKIYRADIKLRLCNSTFKNREEVLEQEGFPFQKDAWFAFCDKVEQALPSLLFLNSISLLLGFTGTVFCFLGLLGSEEYVFGDNNDYEHLWYPVGFGLYFADFLFNWCYTAMTTKRLRKMVMDASADDLLLKQQQQEMSTITVELDETQWFPPLSVLILADKYAIHVITTGSSSSV